MKIYTKAGDAGQTYLASGVRVPKTDGRVELYGTCDELNSFLGLALTYCKLKDPRFAEVLSGIQHLLFEVGSELAGYIPKGQTESIIKEEDIASLETEIDRLTESLIPLKNFVLPGGTELASALHIARTVSRRLERDVIRYIESGGNVSQSIRTYLNRLSDYFFTAARFANQAEGVSETTWKSRTKP
ncbi:cob(I)yrinic acid a,c-diamide adenosyltransferase [Leptospira ilyithenensis]|uniref:Corrinoid adenosyltransferase n=1 Tax=Leptospira ilyithenensis TaxID=2484901 RepID=A0A4R9LP37_9LEPT|nr:cob(I)yrinic acid a,c-diamide adenosyltransferase [Leptospira ilyithenensis]TGN08449.1 cob(I)yrinic acid a,c-diamide adenosyltransferase [Leptospira ilyithenensis]